MTPDEIARTYHHTERGGRLGCETFAA